jgi:hypothetical protein
MRTRNTRETTPPGFLDRSKKRKNANLSEEAGPMIRRWSIAGARRLDQCEAVIASIFTGDA